MKVIFLDGHSDYENFSRIDNYWRSKSTWQNGKYLLQFRKSIKKRFKLAKVTFIKSRYKEDVYITIRFSNKADEVEFIMSDKDDIIVDFRECRY